METIATHQIHAVFHEGKEVEIKPVDIDPDEELLYTTELTRISKSSKYYTMPGMFMVTNKRAIHSPISFYKKLPGEVWSVKLEDIDDIYKERRRSDKKDIVMGLFTDVVFKIPIWLIKNICFELSDGSKQYFIVQDGWTIHEGGFDIKNIKTIDIKDTKPNFDAWKTEEVEEVIKELRREIVKARVYSALSAPKGGDLKREDRPESVQDRPLTSKSNLENPALKVSRSVVVSDSLRQDAKSSDNDAEVDVSAESKPFTPFWSQLSSPPEKAGTESQSSSHEQPQSSVNVTEENA